MEYDEKLIEAIARKWCELQGLDPDERVAHGADPSPSGFVPDVCLYSARWQRAAIPVRERALMDAAMRAVLGPL